MRRRREPVGQLPCIYMGMLIRIRIIIIYIIKEKKGRQRRAKLQESAHGLVLAPIARPAFLDFVESCILATMRAINNHIGVVRLAPTFPLFRACVLGASPKGVIPIYKVCPDCSVIHVIFVHLSTLCLALN